MNGHNIGGLIDRFAEETPDRDAIIVPHKKQSISFSALQRESDAIACGLIRKGLEKGDRVLVMTPFGIEFMAITFALFRAGLTPSLIDPGMGRKHILKCITETQPAAMIASPLAHIIRRFFPAPFQSVRHFITVGNTWLCGGVSLQKIKQEGSQPVDLPITQPDDPAAILFTSGSTGPPKGACYTHGMFLQQTQLLQSAYDIQAGQTDLPTFPLFALFGIGLGMTAIIPDMDFTRPAKADPQRITRLIQERNIDSSFGSPALWNTVARYCQANKVSLPGLKRILIAGAPVPGSLLKRFDDFLSEDCRVFTPYGATEALPVASIERREILNETWQRSEEGEGVCVGRPVEGMQFSVIRISDDPIEEWSSELLAPEGEVGELVAKAPWVTQAYFNRPEATRLSKIKDGDRFRHRMGDLGRQDASGRIWFYGRKSQRVVCESRTIYTIPCEAIFNRHPQVRRSALVGVGEWGKQTPLIIIELEPSSSPVNRNALRAELLELARRYPASDSIRQVLFYPEFPVDIRHNAKIFREQLAKWAETQGPQDSSA
ncbi:MAG: AMP-binding protein [Candidatus Nitrohelix vancouverensis]|uniref:AMP-binding protein n=1 Tax=Candidatus Nitrohelix vancouverensis TaxID=2705534 RepID=A0A7T0C2L5_9BACT|nr:MAG: AMP-binding protein [Candidatus Nitrohelix vancouverensis]